MAELLGRPMIRHVYDNVVRSHVVDLTAVATCDVEIAEYVASIGGRAVMTSDEHERASERCAEALQTVEE
jgi:3-deoxy-manno-octulosonate cytidylyltransferase (CMP-KDO synthetase)